MSGATYCIACKSERIVSGSIQAGKGGAVFTPKQIKMFTWSFPYIKINPDAYICIDCGFVWSSVNTEEARRKIKKVVEQELINRLGL